MQRFATLDLLVLPLDKLRHRCEQLSLLKRFGQVGVSAVLHAPEVVLLLVLLGEKDDLDTLGLGVVFQLTTDLITIFTRHDDIQDHQIRMLSRHLLQCLFTITGRHDVVPSGREGSGDQFESRRTVINDENCAHRCVPSTKLYGYAVCDKVVSL